MFFRKQHNRKWQERPQLYRGRFFYLRQIAQVLLAFSVCVGIVSLVLYFRNSHAIAIHKVEVFGELIHLTKEDVVALSGIQNGQNLFSVSLEKVQDNIMRYSWVKEAQVRREFPDTIQINITERKPLALLLSDKLYLVDETGKIYKNLEANDPKDLPVLTGFKSERLKKYPRLMTEQLSETLHFLLFVQNQEFYREAQIAEVHFDDAFGFTVYTLREGLEIYYGLGEYKEKQAKLEKFKLSEYFKSNRIVRLDLDPKNRIVARNEKQVSQTVNGQQK